MKKQQSITVDINVCKKSLKKIKVEQRHIKKGKQGDTAYCPIACAIREALGPEGKDADICVGLDEASFTIEREVSVPLVVCGEQYEDITRTVRITGELNLGEKANTFIDAFDDDKKAVKPQTFVGKPVIDVEVG